MPAKFNLIVNTTQEFDIPTGSVTSEISRPVKKRVWLIVERIADESLSG